MLDLFKYVMSERRVRATGGGTVSAYLGTVSAYLGKSATTLTLRGHINHVMHVSMKPQTYVSGILKGIVCDAYHDR